MSPTHCGHVIPGNGLGRSTGRPLIPTQTGDWKRAPPRSPKGVVEDEEVVGCVTGTGLKGISRWGSDVSVEHVGDQHLLREVLPLLITEPGSTDTTWLGDRCSPSKLTAMPALTSGSRNIRRSSCSLEIRVGNRSTMSPSASHRRAGIM